MLDFDQHLKTRIPFFSSQPHMREIFDYALRPPGKLFRPRLLEALCADLGFKDERDILTLGCAIEIHHAYSLVHDDLPAMDNDLIRRGKPSTHAKYGEWKALLIGDALLAQSYRELERLHSPQKDFIRRVFLWATAGGGLILGQWIDLSGLASSTAARLRMHELKTSRLMQIATLAGLALKAPPTLSDVKQGLRLGAAIGIAFQLLDDLDDLNQPSEHELRVNPFVLNALEATQALKKNLALIQQGQYPQLQAFLKDFLDKSFANLKTSRGWTQHFKTDDLKKIEALYQ
jgi:geranylgeranyl pyrophosphate synthase